VDVLFDYRPALVHRTGVGEYVHELASALVRQAPPGSRLHLFSSSTKDRLTLPAELVSPVVEPHDHRVPVRVLHWLWHRAGGPSVEWLTGGRFDVAHAAHPLLIPSGRAAGVVTVHDLDFLDHPERTTREMRRDYAALAARHAVRADQVIAVSDATKREVVARFAVAPERVTVARAGVPRWAQGGRRSPRVLGGGILFLGTLEPRKNVGTLLDAYARLVERRRDVPRLTLAGRATPAAAEWLERCHRPPLAGRVDVLGYVPDGGRRDLFERASMLVLPSWNEGFGLPVLEAMALGVPVIVSDRGALPEVAGDAALYCDPGEPDSIADAMRRTLDDEAATASRVDRGHERVAPWSWDAAGAIVWQAYRDAMTHRRERHAHRG
jgi:glycosyltransferase involved in cell wall biosynthesis